MNHCRPVSRETDSAEKPHHPPVSVQELVRIPEMQRATFQGTGDDSALALVVFGPGDVIEAIHGRQSAAEKEKQQTS